MTSHLHTAAAWSVFPLVLGGGVAVAAVLLGRGVSETVAVPAAVFAGGFAILLLEIVLPYRAAWQRSHGDLRTDIAHIVVSGAATEIVRALLLGGAAAVAAATSRALGAPLWPAGAPIAAQVVLAVLLGEFGAYWAHRLQHTTRLFRLHAVHHSAPRVYLLNAQRVHPLDTLLAVSLSMIPLAALGLGGRALALYTVIAAVGTLLQHANVDMRLGPLNYVFSMAEVHRWHHSRRLDESNANYGTVLLVWDLVFRTRFFPADREPPEDVGLTDLPAFPTTYTGQILAPFRRALWTPAGRLPLVRRSADPGTASLADQVREQAEQKHDGAAAGQDP